MVLLFVFGMFSTPFASWGWNPLEWRYSHIAIVPVIVCVAVMHGIGFCAAQIIRTSRCQELACNETPKKEQTAQ